MIPRWGTPLRNTPDILFWMRTRCTHLLSPQMWVPQTVNCSVVTRLMTTGSQGDLASGHLPLVSLNLIANPHADRHPEGSRMPHEWRRAACVSKT